MLNRLPPHQPTPLSCWRLYGGSMDSDGHEGIFENRLSSVRVFVRQQRRTDDTI